MATLETTVVPLLAVRTKRKVDALHGRRRPYALPLSVGQEIYEAGTRRLYVVRPTEVVGRSPRPLEEVEAKARVVGRPNKVGPLHKVFMGVEAEVVDHSICAANVWRHRMRPKARLLVGAVTQFGVRPAELETDPWLRAGIDAAVAITMTRRTNAEDPLRIGGRVAKQHYNRPLLFYNL